MDGANHAIGGNSISCAMTYRAESFRCQIESDTPTSSDDLPRHNETINNYIFYNWTCQGVKHDMLLRAHIGAARLTLFIDVSLFI